MRYGHCEKAVTLWLIAIIPTLILVMMGMPFFYKVATFVSWFISFSAVLWLPFQINKNRLNPLLDDAKPDETVWLRITKDQVFIPQFVKKSTLGLTKGLIYGEKADVLDDGDFPIKTLNGNPANIQYDIVNTTIDLKKSLARRVMMKRYNVKSGIDAYNIALREGKVMKINEK